MPASLSAVHSCASDRNPPSFRQQVLNITNTISRVFHESQVHRIFEIITKKVLFFGIIPTSSLWYFSECKHKKKSCVLDLNDALLRLYVLPPKNRNEKTKNYVTNCTTNYSSKNLAVKFLLYVLEHTNLASTIKKKKKYLKSDNTPPIKIVANKKILKFAPTSKPTTS